MTATTPLDAFEHAFAIRKPVLGMIHLKGNGSRDVLDRAVREIDLLTENGVDAVLVEDYFGTADDVERVLAHLNHSERQVCFGVNLLSDAAMAFALADEYGATFVQMDSVAGHLPSADDAEFAEWVATLRARSRALLLGGVRFKYQPVRSGNPVDVDLRLATERCDAVVVTGDGTGVETSIEKIRTFREILGPDFPLVVGAGVTASNCAASLASADGVIVGSSLKEGGRVGGDVGTLQVAEFMDVVRDVRLGATG